MSIVVDICSHPSGARNLYTADRIDFLKLCDGAWVWGIYCWLWGYTKGRWRWNHGGGSSATEHHFVRHHSNVSDSPPASRPLRNEGL